MLYRSLITSRHELIHSCETLADKFGVFRDILREHFDDGEKCQCNEDDDEINPIHRAYQLVYSALPSELKEIGPSSELLRCFLESISSIAFTESAAIMHIVS